MKTLNNAERVLVSGGCTDCKRIIIEHSPATPTPSLGVYAPEFEIFPSPGWPEIDLAS